MSTASERNPIRTRGLTMIPYGSREEWLQIRRGYIGGSDAGAIIGMNPYSSAFSVWAEKVGKVPEFNGNVATRVGSYLEDLVARLFMDETGKKVQRLNFTVVNPEYPFACANIDREVIGEDAVLEIKTTNSFVNVKKFRTGEYPEMWYAQMTHYLAVTGARKCYLAVLSECREFRIFELDRDEDEIKALMDAEREFWNTYVVPQKAPPADGHSATSETIKKMFPEEAGDSADLTGMDDLFTQRKLLNEHIGKLKEELDGLDNRVKVVMGSRSTGAYECIPDAVDVREGELVSYDRLTGKAVFSWIEDEDAREDLPIIGYAGYFKLLNGAEKTIYMTVKQIRRHEQKNRKGQYMTKGWRENFEEMARKTVIRRLCSKYALMSIDYRNAADRDAVNLATALAHPDFPEDPIPDGAVIDGQTGEVTGLPEGQGEKIEYPDFLKEGAEDAEYV